MAPLTPLTVEERTTAHRKDPAMKTIDATKLNEMMHSDEPVTVVNVLPEDSFAEEHIPGSHNIPGKDPNFEAMVQDLVDTKSSRIVLYCASTECDASPKAAKRLENAGFKNVIDFEGGMKEWKAEGHKVESGATI